LVLGLLVGKVKEKAPLVMSGAIFIIISRKIHKLPFIIHYYFVLLQKILPI